LVFFDAKKRQTTCQIQKLGPKTRKPLNLWTCSQFAKPWNFILFFISLPPHLLIVSKPFLFLKKPGNPKKPQNLTTDLSKGWCSHHSTPNSCAVVLPVCGNLLEYMCFTYHKASHEFSRFWAVGLSTTGQMCALSYK
jgi:hypothetical protein